MLSRLRCHLPLWRRALRRRRRLLALLALAVAVTAVLPSLLPPSARGVEVIVANQDLPVGTVIGPEHLRTVRIAAQLLPVDAVTSPEHLLGRTTISPVSAGSPLLDVLLSGGGQPYLPDGAVLMVVPIPELLAPHLSPGTRIELLPTDAVTGTSGGIIAQVIEAAAPGPSTVDLGGSGTGSTQILVSVDRAHSGELAHALGAGNVLVSVIG